MADSFSCFTDVCCRPNQKDRPVDYIKHDLLTRSDWVGLTMTRPVIPFFVRQTRPRKPTKRQKGESSPQSMWTSPQVTKPGHVHQRPTHSTETYPRPSSPHTPPGHCSIGTSSKDPHSQDTQALPLQAGKHPSQRRQFSSDGLSEHSKISDRSENKIPSTTRQRHMTRSTLSQRLSTHPTPSIPRKRNQTAAVPLKLIPLNEARGISSFDLFLQRSSSVPRPISTPKLLSECTILDFRARGASISGRNHATGLHQKNSSSPPEPESSVVGNQHESAMRQPGFGNQQASGRTVGVDGIPTSWYLQEPRFTLDEQVELESKGHEMGFKRSEPSDVRVRSACGSLADSERRVSPSGIASSNCNATSYMRAIKALQSDRYDDIYGVDVDINVEGHQDWTFPPKAKDETMKELSPASYMGNARSTELSFATCHDGDSEAWPGPMISSDLLPHENGFSFGVAPPICPRDQPKDSIHRMPAYDTDELAMLRHWDSSSIIGEPPGGLFSFMPTGNAGMFASVPRSQCSTKELSMKPTLMDCYHEKPLASGSYAGGVWASESLSGDNIWKENQSISTPIRPQPRPIVGLKRKADAMSETVSTTPTPSKYFETRENHWLTHEPLSGDMMWEPMRDRGFETSHQGLDGKGSEITEHGYGMSFQFGKR